MVLSGFSGRTLVFSPNPSLRTPTAPLKSYVVVLSISGSCVVMSRRFSLNKTYIMFLFIFLSACASSVPKALIDNPGVVISNDGVNNQPAFKSVTFNRASTQVTLADKCLFKETGSHSVSIEGVYSVTAQSAYRSDSLRRSIPFQYGLSVSPRDGIYRFENIRFNEGQLGGPLFASEAIDADRAYTEMESIAGRVYACLAGSKN